MARRSAADIQKAKEAKQKKLLLVLLPLFLGLVAWQGPKMYKSLFAQPAPEATPVETTTAPTTPTPGAAPTPAPGAAPAAPGGLADTDPLPSAASDQLLSLGRFTSRNPFVPPPGAGGEPAPGADAPLLSSAVIEVNGTADTVSVNGTFPMGDPIFQLVSVSETQVVITLTSGAFQGGEANVQIAVGEQVDLVGDDGTTYTVTVVSVS